jgi:hypothetical protein
MATVVEAFKDGKGNLHVDATRAIVADIATALGRVGDEGGLTHGVARLILEKRAEIEAAFADFDKLQGKAPKVIDMNDHVRRAL